MEMARLVRLVAAPLLLAIVALAAWRSAENADFEDVSGARVEYEAELASPMLSARRIPQTLQAPVSDDILASTLAATVDAYPDRSCLSVVTDGRSLEPSATIPGGLVPASNQKLLTTFAALEVLGEEFTFTTTAAAAGTIQGGVLDGDLYLVGDGDPFLTTDDWMNQYEDLNGRTRTRLEDLADAVVTAGITEVTGSVIGDETLFDSERYGPWDSRLIVQKQSGPLSALTVNEGFVDWPSRFLDSFRPRAETDDPPLHGASVFADLLQQRGVTIGGAPSAGQAPSSSQTVAQVVSPPLTDIVTHINSHSSNIGAELVLKRLGLERLGTGSTEAGAEVVRQTLAENGVPMDDVIVNDGSGLAESNRLTCQALTGVLAAAGIDSEFASSLSVAGERGSLDDRFVETDIEGRVLAKTGTLAGVRALAGYAVSTVDDGAVEFAYIINDPDIAGDEQLTAQEPLLESLVHYPEGPTIDDLSPRPARPQ